MFAPLRRFLFLPLFFLLAFPPVGFCSPDDCPGGNWQLTEDANLRSEPDGTSPVVAVLRQGTRVRRIFHRKEWSKVELTDDGQNGWIHFSLLQNLPCGSPTPAAPPKTIEAGNFKVTRPTVSTHTRTQRPPTLIGVIDIQQVINQSRRGREARQRYEDLRRAGTGAEVEQAEGEIISRIIVEIQAVVEDYARRHGFTHVVNKNSGSIFYNDSSFNITDDIIGEYDQQAAISQPTP